jgi:hypothetical protein
MAPCIADRAILITLDANCPADTALRKAEGCLPAFAQLVATGADPFVNREKQLIELSLQGVRLELEIAEFGNDTPRSSH